MVLSFYCVKSNTANYALPNSIAGVRVLRGPSQAPFTFAFGPKKWFTSWHPIDGAEINLALNLPVIQDLALAVFASAEPYFKYRDQIAVEVDKDVVSLPGFGHHVGKENHLLQRQCTIACFNRCSAVFEKGKLVLKVI